MSDLLEHLKQVYVARTPQMRDIGLEITAVEPARGTMRLPARKDWLGDPERGLMHVGPLIVLADSACGIAVGAAVQARDVTYATLDLRLDWLRPALPGKDVYSEAHCYRLSRSVAFIRAEVWQDDRAHPVATAQSAFMLGTPSTARPAAQASAQTGQSAAIAATMAAAPVEASNAPVTHTSDAVATPWIAPQASESPLPGQHIPYVEYLGIRVAPAPQQPTFRLPFQQKLIGNPHLPALHGGVVAGFAETSAILHLMQSLQGVKQPKGIDFSIDYLRSGRPEECFARCEVVRLGGRVALVTVRVWQRSPDVPIAVARGHFLLAAKD